MINQTSSSINRPVFTPLQSNSALYAITQPITKTQKKELEEIKEKKSHKLGYKIAKGALIVGFGVFMLTKGFPKNMRNNIMKFLEEKSSKLVAEGGTLTNIETAYLKTLDKARIGLMSSKSIFNFSNLKDVFFRKITKNVPIIKNICEKITQTFEKISIKTCHNSYKKTSSNFDKMFDAFSQANKKIKDSGKETNKIDSLISIMKKKFYSSFSIPSVGSRIEETKKMLGELDEQYWSRTYGNIEGFVKKDSYKTFVAEELASPAKTILGGNVGKLKREISNGFKDNYLNIKKLIGDISMNVSSADKNTRKNIHDLSAILESYKNNNGDLIIQNTLLNKLKELQPVIKDEKLSSNLKTIIEVLTKNEQGYIQKLMSEYKQLLPNKKDYDLLEKSVNKAINSLNKSTDIETDKLFDKIRDLLIGSAPMDVLSVLSSLGVVSIGLSKSDNKDEIISVALKYGIPAIGAVSISLFCTMALVSGGPALAIGTVSGLVINKLGEFIDKKRKEFKENPPTLEKTAQNIREAIILK